MIHKKDIRRTAYGTCVVALAGDKAGPCKATLTLERRLGCCQRLNTRMVCDFDLHDIAKDIPTIGHAFLDLEYLFKVSMKADACVAQIKICVAHRSGQKHVARVLLEEFLDRLFLSGRPDSFFLYINKGNVTLCQANQDFPKVMPEWPFERQGKHTHQHLDDNDKCSDTDDCLVDISKATDINEEIVINGEGHEEQEGGENDLTQHSETKLEEDAEENDNEMESDEEKEEEKQQEMTDSSEEEEELENTDDDDSGWETFEEDEVDDESDEEDKEEEMTENNDEEEEMEDTDDDSGWETFEEDNGEEEVKAAVRVHRDVRKKPHMEMGDVHIFLAGMAAAWRHTRRALLIAVVVLLLLATLDMLLPPLDEADWH